MIVNVSVQECGLLVRRIARRNIHPLATNRDGGRSHTRSRAGRDASRYSSHQDMLTVRPVQKALPDVLCSNVVHTSRYSNLANGCTGVTSTALSIQRGKDLPYPNGVTRHADHVHVFLSKKGSTQWAKLHCHDHVNERCRHSVQHGEEQSGGPHLVVLFKETGRLHFVHDSLVQGHLTAQQRQRNLLSLLP